MCCFCSESFARGKRAGFNFLHAGKMTHLLQWFCAWVPYCCVTNHPKTHWLKATCILLFLRTLWVGWGSARWLFYWSRLESLMLLHSDGGQAECLSSCFSHVSGISLLRLSPAGPAWYSSGDLWVPRRREQKLAVFLRSGLRSPIMLCVLYSLRKTQRQGECISKGRRMTPSPYEGPNMNSQWG